MLTISKPLSAAQIRTYHAEEFTNARTNYYTAADYIHGQWHGRLARAWGLSGEVTDEQIHRLAEGQHPGTGDVLVRHQTARTYLNRRGERVTTMAHRAGWDATFSAPKSVSLTALVGGDTRVTEAHRASVATALDELEHYVQARIGGSQAPETTGRWVAATFDHDSARPVEGYAAPQLHTHVVIFNVTERINGESRALQPRELYKTQQYATAVYRSELATHLSALGYDLERGRHGQPEIRGYSQAYLEASSPRRRQITEQLAKVGQASAEAAHIAAHQTRDAKIDRSHAEMQAQHQRLARADGAQPARVVEAARRRGAALEMPFPGVTAETAVTYARDRSFEREAVVDERALLRDALRRSMGEVTFGAIKTAFEARVAKADFLRVEPPRHVPARVFTTPEMIALEQETIAHMRAGRGTQQTLASRLTDGGQPYDASRALNASQQVAVYEILASRDRVLALEGIAGGGKTTAVAAVREAAERAGYRVEGLAPTTRATHTLAEAGLASQTLQHHLARQDDRLDGAPRLYVLDESSLTSTRQMHRFLHWLHAQDRVLLVGDVRQHHAIDAGRPYHQLQQAGVHTVRLDQIIRQRDPALRGVVETLARGEIPGAIRHLEQQGRVHEVPVRTERIATIARAFAEDPDRTLVVSPDHQSRRDLNQAIHRLLQERGRVEAREHAVRVWVTRHEVTGADRQWAAQYEPGNLVRYTTGSTQWTLPATTYARVEAVDVQQNQLTVTRPTGQRVTYDPRRLQGVTLYRDEERHMAVGDRVQFTAPFGAQRVANGALGTLTQIDGRGHVQVRLDSGRRIAFTLDDHPHLDHGYAVTSHSSQGQTADRVLVHVETASLGAPLVNRRFAYVAISRGRDDAQIYTDNHWQLADVLGRDVAHRSALEWSHGSGSPAHTMAPLRLDHNTFR